MLFSVSQYLIYIFLILSLISISPSFSDPRISDPHIICGPKNQTSNKDLPSEFLSVMDSLETKISLDSHYASADTASVYGLVQCHEDLSRSECKTCFTAIRSNLSQCLPANSGRVHMDGCFIRYENYDFFEESVSPSFDQANCTNKFTLETYMYEEFSSKENEAFVNVTLKAGKTGGFGAVEVKGGAFTIYALAQCWQTLDENGCRECLVSARASLRICKPRTEGRAMFTGCYMRFSTEKFINDGAETIQDGDVDARNIAEYLLAAIGVASLAYLGAYIGYKRLSKQWLNSTNRGSKQRLNFKYETLEKATDSFSESRKLGQGGAGSVFKGLLPDGKVVAVKKLVFNTGQWVDHFFNEVNLISGIQHKNLVRLLGCSIEGPDCLLVYEYLPNKSLDKILFVKNTIHILNWQQRFNIITGTAEGLAYLHEGWVVRIIHRDIKTSNILLDEKLSPKIADFGLARCAAPDKSHTNSGIAGTLGYMAPEYLVRGQLTEKADVYAFGVVVLEIATGKRNSAFSQGSDSMLYSVWHHYKNETLMDAIDVRLRGKVPEKEGSKVLMIGLLCTQASLVLRPTMSEIIKMLTDKDYRIPSPEQPPFLNASVLASGDSTRISEIINTSVLNQQKNESV